MKKANLEILNAAFEQIKQIKYMPLEVVGDIKRVMIELIYKMEMKEKKVRRK